MAAALVQLYRYGCNVGRCMDATRESIAGFAGRRTSEDRKAYDVEQQQGGGMYASTGEERKEGTQGSMPGGGGGTPGGLAWAQGAKWLQQAKGFGAMPSL